MCLILSLESVVVYNYPFHFGNLLYHGHPLMG